MPVNIGDEIIRNVPEQVQKNMDDIAELENKASSLEIEVNSCLKKASIVDNLNSTATNRPLSAKQGNVLKQMIASAVSGVFKPMGSLTVAQINALDTSTLEVGYVYNVLDSGTITLGSLLVNAGDNVVWVENGGVGEWDALAGTIDVSNLVDLTSAQTITGLKTFANTITSTVANETNAFSWGTFYLTPDSNGKMNVGQSNNQIKFYDSNIRVDATLLRPQANNTTDLGDSTNKFKNLYISTRIYTPAIDNEAGGDISVIVGNDRALKPSWDNHYNLGNASYKWKDAYIAGVLSDGTNSVNIADLKALIDYARAQGWIV